MKILYKTFHRKSDNSFFDYAVSFEGCCERIIGFVLENRVDYGVAENILIVKRNEDGTLKTDQYFCCQFCGSRHTSVDISDKKQKRPTTKQIIKKS